MATFQPAVLTAQGQALYTKAQSGTQLQFTRMQIGSGQLAEGQDPSTFTALITPIDYFSINQITTSTNNAYFSGIFENTNINSSTYVCEIGIFAQDPTAGEILYAYANAGANGDNIPPISDGPESTQFKITVAVGNATSVTATIPSDAYIPATDKGSANGVATLDANAQVPASQLDNVPNPTPASIGAVANAGSAVSIQAGTQASKPAAGTAGRVYIETDTARIMRDDGSAWQKVGVVNWADLDGTPTTISGYGITDAVRLNQAQTWTAAQTISAILNATTLQQNGHGVWDDNNLPSPAQTDVDNQFSDQTINGKLWVGSSTTSFLNIVGDANGAYIEAWSGDRTASADLILTGRYAAATTVKTPNNTLDDGTGKSKLIGGIDTANNGQYMQFQESGGTLQYNNNGGGWTNVAGVKNVQTGTVTSPTSAGTIDVTISAVGSKAQPRILNSLMLADGGSSNQQGSSIWPELTSSTNLRIHFDGFPTLNSVQISIAWEVTDNY